MTNSTRRNKRLYIAFKVLSWVMCFGTALTLVLLFLNKADSSTPGMTVEEAKTALGEVLWGYIITLLPMIILAIIVKDKIKPLVWMANVIMGNIFSPVVMYIVFAAWILETYVLTPLSNTFKSRYIINREMDKRVE